MARKLVRSLFWLYDPPPFLVRGGQKFSLRFFFPLEMIWNGEKLARITFLTLWLSPPLTPITPVFMSKGHGRGGGGKFFYQKIFSSRNDLIWRENWLAPWHHGWHHVGTMVGFLAPWSPPLVGRVGGGGGATKFLAKKYFLPEMVWNGEKVVVSLFVKDQGSMSRPFWDNSFLFFLLCCSIWDEHICTFV